MSLSSANSKGQVRQVLKAALWGAQSCPSAPREPLWKLKSQQLCTHTASLTPKRDKVLSHFL